MNTVFKIRNNIYWTEMLIQVFLWNCIHRTIKQCLKVTGIGLDHINAYLAELIDDSAYKVAYLQWRMVKLLLLFIAETRNKWLLLLENHVRSHDALMLGSIIYETIITDRDSVKVSKKVDRASLDNL